MTFGIFDREPEPLHHDHNCKPDCRTCFRHCMKLFKELKSLPENELHLTKEASIALDKFNPQIKLKVRRAYAGIKYRDNKRYPEKAKDAESIQRLRKDESRNQVEHQKDINRLNNIRRFNEKKALEQRLKPKSLTSYTVYIPRIIQDNQGNAIIGNDPIPINTMYPEGKELLNKVFGQDNSLFVPNQHEGGNINKSIKCKKCGSGFYSDSDFKQHEKRCKVFKRFRRSKK